MVSLAETENGAFYCPILHELMSDPVLTCDGYTYERDAIERWLEDNNTSPITNNVLANKELTPNYALRSAIEKEEQTRLAAAHRSIVPQNSKPTSCHEQQYQLLYQQLHNCHEHLAPGRVRDFASQISTCAMLNTQGVTRNKQGVMRNEQRLDYLESLVNKSDDKLSMEVGIYFDDVVLKSQKKDFSNRLKKIFSRKFNSKIKQCEKKKKDEYCMQVTIKSPGLVYGVARWTDPNNPHIGEWAISQGDDEDIGVTDNMNLFWDCLEELNCGDFTQVKMNV
jgi:hypothetical protein